MSDVQVGDVWEFVYLGTHSRHTIIERISDVEFRSAEAIGNRVAPGIPHHHGQWRLISRAGQPVTVEHDRSGCKAWCGGLAPGGAGSWCTDGFAYWDSKALGVLSDKAGKGPHFCSPRCRDLRLPPMGERAGVIITGVEVDDGYRRIVNMDVCPACVGLTVRHVTECPKRIRELQILERTPSAVASASERMRDIFTDLCDIWDLLPDAQ